MRKVIFRGFYPGDVITRQKAQWLHGDIYHRTNGDVQIRDNYSVLSTTVVPDTVGQFTGLKDKEGKDVYEGDILKNRLGVFYEVLWENCIASFILKKLGSEDRLSITVDGFSEYKVVGNIHDKSEPLDE